MQFSLRSLFYFQLYFALTYCSLDVQPRVSFGETAIATNWPSQVLIRNHRSGLICGGSLISDEWVLTAAHCVRPQVGDAMKHKLTLGAQRKGHAERNQVYRGVKQVVRFPQYETQNHSHDMALIQMDTPIDFENKTHLKPMCLDLCGLDINDRKCITTGFGSRYNYGGYPDNLQELEMKPFDHEKCKEIHHKFYERQRSKEEVTDLQFCMVSKENPTKPGAISIGGVCPGDSGGPLQCLVENSYYQTGVAWSTTDCETQASVYQVISKYADFITKTTNYKLPNYCSPNPACK